MQMKYFELIKAGTSHDFVKYRRVAVTISLVVNALILLGAAVWLSTHRHAGEPLVIELKTAPVRPAPAPAPAPSPPPTKQ